MAERIKAIPTIYKGIKFRSKLEAQWAKFFDENNIEWIYEPEGIVFNDGTCYLPDFYLPKNDMYFEVKGIMSIKDEDKILHLSKNYDVIIGYSNGHMEYFSMQVKNPQSFIRLIFSETNDKKNGFFSFNDFEHEVNLTYLDDLTFFYSFKNCLYCVSDKYFKDRINKVFCEKWNKESYIDVVKRKRANNGRCKVD